MKKFLALFGAVGLTATSSMAVVACGEKDKKTTDFEDNRIVKDLKELAKPFTGNVSNEAILEAFNTVNKDVLDGKVEAADVEIGDIKNVEADGKITGHTVEITAKTGDKAKFKGKVTVKFTIAAKFDLNHLKNTDLGDIKQAANPTPEQVVTMLKAKNTGLDLEVADVTVESITEKGATVKAKDDSTKFKGQVTVKFNRTAAEENPAA